VTGQVPSCFLGSLAAAVVMGDGGDCLRFGVARAGGEEGGEGGEQSESPKHLALLSLLGEVLEGEQGSLRKGGGGFPTYETVARATRRFSCLSTASYGPS
jgi:hypothetical protein